jgi:hypothetical protein
MSLTVGTLTYGADSFQKDAIGYTGALKTVSVKDDWKLARTAPKPTVDFSGVGRTQAKWTRTLATPTSLTPSWDAIVEINVSVPVGYASADVDTLLTEAGAFLGGAQFKSHVKAQKINF